MIFLISIYLKKNNNNKLIKTFTKYMDICIIKLNNSIELTYKFLNFWLYSYRIDIRDIEFLFFIEDIKLICLYINKQMGLYKKFSYHCNRLLVYNVFNFIKKTSINLYKIISYSNLLSYLTLLKNYLKSSLNLKIMLFSVNTLSIYFLFYKFNFNNFTYFSYKSFTILILVYIYMTFLHLSKYYLFNKYTSVIQRFWKRSFSVFWSLEITLFTIYLYLMLISPAEYNYKSYNHKEYNNNLLQYYTSYYTYIYVLSILMLTCLYLNLFFLKKKNKKNNIVVTLFIITLIYFYILYFEFYKYFFINNWYNHNTNFLDSKSKINQVSYLNEHIFFKNNTYFFKTKNTDLIWSKTYNHFLSIIIILKFWHLLFIISFYFLLCLKYLNLGKLHFDSLGANYQNSLFVFTFYLISYIMFFKKTLYFTITFLYTSCSTTVNFSSVTYYYYVEYWNYIELLLLTFNNILY